VPAKLIVTNARGGSRITLVGTSGTELLTSKVFTEPRAKGATLRSLRGLLGEEVVVEDSTAAGARRVSVAATKTTVASTRSVGKHNGKSTATRRRAATSK
jgi:hypothetical protein